MRTGAFSIGAHTGEREGSYQKPRALPDFSRIPNPEVRKLAQDLYELHDHLNPGHLDTVERYCDLKMRYQQVCLLLDIQGLESLDSAGLLRVNHNLKTLSLFLQGLHVLERSLAFTIGTQREQLTRAEQQSPGDHARIEMQGGAEDMPKLRLA